MWNALIESWNTLTKQQKVSVCVLGVCGVLALTLSVYKVGARIREPFLVDRSEILSIKEIIGTTPEEETAKQKRTDTDGDGLSDWDEVNVYKTNPNLRDSCGDGITDNVRVVTGKNLGCAGSLVGTESAPAAATGTLRAPGVLAPFGSAALFATEGTGLLPAPSQTEGADAYLPRDAKAIRAVLKGKVDQAKLDQLTDEQLLQLYDEAIAIQASRRGATSTAP